MIDGVSLRVLQQRSLGFAKNQQTRCLVFVIERSVILVLEYGLEGVVTETTSVSPVRPVISSGESGNSEAKWPSSPIPMRLQAEGNSRPMPSEGQSCAAGFRPDQILSKQLFVAGGVIRWHIALIAQSDVNSMPGQPDGRRIRKHSTGEPPPLRTKVALSFCSNSNNSACLMRCARLRAAS